MSAEYSPMVQQYRKLKNQHPDEVLFFRLGDFYEMFFEDAEKISKELGLTLTSREGGNKTRIPMCGVPYHSVDNYLAKLIDRGYKIAICEQTSDPKLSKGIVDRKVVKIITPGTVLTESLLKSNDSNFLVLLYEENEILSLAATDISTGECIWSKYDSNRRISNVCDELYHLMPAELVLVGNIENIGLLKDFLNKE